MRGSGGTALERRGPGRRIRAGSCVGAGEGGRASWGRGGLCCGEEGGRAGEPAGPGRPARAPWGSDSPSSNRDDGAGAGGQVRGARHRPGAARVRVSESPSVEVGNKRPPPAVVCRCPRPRTLPAAHRAFHLAPQAPTSRTTAAHASGKAWKTKGDEGELCAEYYASRRVAAPTGSRNSVMNNNATDQVTNLRWRAAEGAEEGDSFPPIAPSLASERRVVALSTRLPSPHRRRRPRSSVSRLTSWGASSFCAGPGTWRGPGLPCPRAARRSGA